jgi:hypothetical protein
MKYMYTNTPDDGCHEIHGVYGRPVHARDYDMLKKQGWVFNPADIQNDDYAQAVALYVDVFGKKPHHKMKVEGILKALEDHANDQESASEPNTDSAGD